MTMKSEQFLQKAQDIIKERGEMRDSPEGERSMENIVKLFNQLTGKDLTESEGWEFMICLKLVRSKSGKMNPDDYLDLISYSSLLGECKSKCQ